MLESLLEETRKKNEPITEILAQKYVEISHFFKSEVAEIRREKQSLENKRKFKNETLDCTNPKKDKVYSGAQINNKFNNSTLILGRILNNQSSPTGKSGLGYDGIAENIYSNKCILDTDQI